MRKLLLALLIAVPLAAQTSSEKLTVHYVEVPVTVIDRAGDPIRGLTAANFEVFDGRKKIKPASFDVIDFTSPESVKLAEANPASRRTFLILFDLGFSSPASLKRAKEAARTFVSENVLKRDLVGVGTIDVERGFNLLVAFTTDRRAALEAIADPLSFHGSDPLQIAGSESFQVTFKSLLETDVSQMSKYEQWYLEHLIDVTRQTVRADEAYARGRIEHQFMSLGSLALTLAAVKGRKQIVYLTEGFDPTLIRGRESRADIKSKDDLNNIISGKGENLWKVDSEKYFGSTSGMSRLTEMAKYFRGSDVLLHAIDIQGARVQNTLTEGATVNSNDALFLVARPTGGSVFQNSNNVKDDFARLLHQQEVVYIIGFQAAVNEAGKFHDLNVKLVGGPAGAEITHRAGYFESGSTDSSVEHTLTAAEVILKDIPQNDVHIAAMTIAFPATGETAKVPVVVEINGNDLLASAKKNDLTAEIFIYAFDDNGTVRDRLYQRLALDTDKVGDKLRANGVKYIATLTLPPGKYAVKTLVRMPATEKKGYVRSDVIVPKVNEVVLLPPFIVDDPQAWLLVKGDNDASYPFHVNGEPFVPSASGHMPNGSVHKLAVFVWNAIPEELKWETTPQATLLAEYKAAGATKLVLQLDDGVPARFGVIVRKDGIELPFTATIPLMQR